MGTKVIRISDGKEFIAEYITTKGGNKRFWVDGKIYTDRQFDKTFKIKQTSV